jgi:DEAD/DEAH box helicase domain-containing protein
VAVRPVEREPWSDLLEEGRADRRLVHETVRRAQVAAVEPLPGGLHPKVREALGRAGVGGLYVHQAESFELAGKGPLIVTTGTASGKSLCFNLPVLHLLSSSPTACALYLYPTKALAQDQARALHALGLPAIRPAIYDGDTPRTERTAIRKRANLILTNPDMLHVGILPNHAAWGDFLHRLEFVVVDEAHVYRGVFGSHVGNVLRRLRRLAAAYGEGEPNVILASATIANPGELAEGLTGREDFALVERDGSPQAERRTAIWNPPLLDEALGVRSSPLREAADLLVGLVQRGARTICFMKSRKAVELIARDAAARLRDEGSPELADRVAPYRAGYTPAQRRELERRLVDGELLGVVATDALELGIDIGSLDAAISVTFPGTVASLRQQWGRAGRRGRGLAVYVAGEDALDQFFCRHPDEFLERPVEAAILDHESEQIHLSHLLCAAHEGPLDDGDAPFLGPRWRGYAEKLAESGELVQRRGRFHLRRPEDYPAARVSLRSASPDNFAVVDEGSGEVLGTVEGARAFSTAHEGAVYLHLGRSYEVQALDLEGRVARVREFGGDYYTQPKRESFTDIEALHARREALGVTLSFGAVSVTEQVIGYQRKRLGDHEVLDFNALDLPQTTFGTQALWYELSEELLAETIPLDALLGSLHAAEHSQIAVLPLLAMCDRWDIGGLSTNFHPQTGVPTIFVYDGHPGGVGISRRGFEAFEDLVRDAYRLVSECPCRDGCPSCVQSPKCGNLNEPLSKAGAAELMARMLEAS